MAVIILRWAKKRGRTGRTRQGIAERCARSAHSFCSFFLIRQAASGCLSEPVRKQPKNQGPAMGLRDLHFSWKDRRSKQISAQLTVRLSIISKRWVHLCADL